MAMNENYAADLDAGASGQGTRLMFVLAHAGYAGGLIRSAISKSATGTPRTRLRCTVVNPHENQRHEVNTRLHNSCETRNECHETMPANKTPTGSNQCTHGIGYSQGERSNAPPSPGWGMPDGDLLIADLMSLRAYPAPAGTKAGK
jgi:hypothetical protein